MRRLLQLATILLLLAAFVIPLLEWFDRWDAPGLGNDTEMGMFFLVLMLCLILMVCERIADGWDRLDWTATLLRLARAALHRIFPLVSARIFVPPQLIFQLQI